jgi:hypothetical protein
VSEIKNFVPGFSFLSGRKNDKGDFIMAITAGVASLSAVTSTTANLSATAATAGTAPYTYQWYRSTTSGFSPGSGNILTGQTALTLADTGLIPNTTYYYVLAATDQVPTTVDYTQVTVLTQPATLSQNQFSQAPYIGMPDLRYEPNTVAAQVSPNQATPLFNGMAVKIDTAITQTGANTIPQVIGCTADTDSVAGFIFYDLKSLQYNAGDLLSVGLSDTVMYLYSTTAITPFTQVTVDLTTGGGVGAKVGSSGANIVGYAFDGASAAGQLIRVYLRTPSFQYA